MSRGMALLIDFGSTFTKLVAVDLGNGELVAVAHAPSTVGTDMTIGLENALEGLKAQLGRSSLNFELKLACSSAAGGLRTVAIGLVKEFTAEAACRTALGAGAKVLKTYSYGLSIQELTELEVAKPDMILLSGGTDGGDSKVILRNAELLSKSNLISPIIVAGNKVVSGEVANILKSGGKEAIITENIMPELDKLNDEPARQAIRELFIRRIVHGKGLDKAEDLQGKVIVPTPTAVLNAALLLAKGTDRQRGMGELMVVDVGGSTTDVDSIGQGLPTQGCLLRGLPEPYSKRTVEGDLGIRANATTIVSKVGEERLLNRIGKCGLDIKKGASYLEEHPMVIPDSEELFAIDAALAWGAVTLAVERHVGKIEVIRTPAGNITLQYGKDLTSCRTVIGTGGVFAYGNAPRQILEGCLRNDQSPLSLKPKESNLYIDKQYVLYAVGLLTEVEPDTALRLALQSIKQI